MGIRLPAVMLASLLALGCASPSLVEHVIRARGGPLRGLARSVEAEVYAGFPGTWRWQTVLAPHRYAWSIVTADETHHYLYDGTTVRAFVGEREVAVSAADTAPLRTHARFAAVANLDALRDPGVRTAARAAEELPSGAARLDVSLADGTAYRLIFDDRMLLVRLSGAVSLAPFGEGELVAEFADFRRVRGYTLPYRTTYWFRGERVADEHALAVCPYRAGVDAAAFAAPRRLPACE
jgi:hypothetical protein